MKGVSLWSYGTLPVSGIARDEPRPGITSDVSNARITGSVSNKATEIIWEMAYGNGPGIKCDGLLWLSPLARAAAVDDSCLQAHQQRTVLQV